MKFLHRVSPWGHSKRANVNGFIDYGGNTDFGLIVGWNDFKGKVLYCSSTGEIIGSGSAIGGIVGDNSGGLIKGSYSTATINATSTSFSGGICGINHIVRFTDLGEFKGTIDGCYFAGKLENGIQQCGITYNNGGILKNCFVDCIIMAGSTNYDISNEAITNSYSTNAFATHENINVIGSLTPATHFKDKTWVKQNIKFGEFVNEAQLWMNPDNVWVFTEGEFPKLYWEV